MKTWIHVEKAFQDAGISYEQKDWVFLCEIESGEFYYSPQSGKWRVKLTRVWRASSSVKEFMMFAYEYPRLEKEAKQSSESKQKSRQKKKTKASHSQRQKETKQCQQKTQNLKDEVRPEFLELFDEKIGICNERNYNPVWLWKAFLDNYFLTPKEICFLCTVLDNDPDWVIYIAKDQCPKLTYKKMLFLIEENRDEWLNYFNSRWHFSFSNETREQEYRQRKHSEQQKNYQRSTQPSNSGEKYQNHLHLLQLKFPFSRQELKTAYRKKARSTHPDTGGTTEAFRRVHTAFEILSSLAS